MADAPKKRQKMIRGPIVLLITWKDEDVAPPIGPFWNVKDAHAAVRELKRIHKGNYKRIETLQVVKLDEALTWIPGL